MGSVESTTETMTIDELAMLTPVERAELFGNNIVADPAEAPEGLLERAKTSLQEVLHRRAA